MWSKNAPRSEWQHAAVAVPTAATVAAAEAAAVAAVAAAAASNSLALITALLVLPVYYNPVGFQML